MSGYYEKGMGAVLVAELNAEKLTFIGGTGLLAIQLRDTCLFADAAAQRIEDLVKELEREREIHRQRMYPEPFKVGSILGRAGDLSYALQILHVWHNWPNVDIEVALPPQSTSGEAK